MEAPPTGRNGCCNKGEAADPRGTPQELCLELSKYGWGQGTGAVAMTTSRLHLPLLGFDLQSDFFFSKPNM